MQIQHQLGARHHLRLRRVHHADEHPRRTRSGRSRRTQAWAERCLAEHQRLTAERDRPAVPGAVRGGPGRAVRGPAPAGRPAISSALDGRRAVASTATASAARWRRRTSAPSSAGCSEELPERQAAAPAGHLRARRLLHRDRERRRHLRLRVALPGRPQRARSTPATAGSTSTPPPRAEPSRRSTPSATATPARTTPGRTCTTCSRPRRCWPSTLCTIHNERFIVWLVDRIRASIENGTLRRLQARLPRPLLRGPLTSGRRRLDPIRARSPSSVKIVNCSPAGPFSRALREFHGVRVGGATSSAPAATRRSVTRGGVVGLERDPVLPADPGPTDLDPIDQLDLGGVGQLEGGPAGVQDHHLRAAVGGEGVLLAEPELVAIEADRPVVVLSRHDQPQLPDGR